MSWARPSALLAALALAAGVAACGSGDGGDDAGAGAAAGTTATSPASAAVRKREIADAYRDVFAAIAARRWRAVCAGYSAAQRRAYAEQGGGACEKGIRVGYGSVEGLRQPRILRVRLEGPDEAVLYVRALAQGNTTPLAMVREGGRWRLDGLDDSANEYGTSNDPRQR